MHTNCALSEVRTEFLYTADIKFILRYQVGSVCVRFVVGKVAGFSPSTSDFSFIFILSMFPTHIHLATTLSRRPSGRNLGPLKKQVTLFTIYMQGFFLSKVKQLYHDSNHSLCTASSLRNHGCPLPNPHTSLCMVHDVSERGKLHDSSSLSSAARHQEHCLF
jgi:hypothetical protein